MSGERVAARTFRDLLVWRRAHEFVLAVYAITVSFPKHETYGLSSQMRRAAVSIAANIAEGFRKRGKADKARFMRELVSEQDLARARSDTAFRQQLMTGNLERLLEALKQMRKADDPSPESARQLRESVELAVKLADRLQAAAQSR